MIYALIFGACAAATAGLAAWAGVVGGFAWAIVPVAAWTSVSFGAVAWAYARAWPALLGKSPDGRLPWWSALGFGPFLVLGRAALRLVNSTGVGTPWTEVAPGLWLGRRPGRGDLAAFRALGVVAVVDLVAEVSRSRALRGDEAYLSLPVLDNAAPSPAQLESALAFVDQHAPVGPVYVHCALGIGRAATVVAAWLLATGRAPSVGAAEASLRAARPGVSLSRAQRAALEAWCAGR